MTAQVYHKATTTNCGTSKEVSLTVASATTTVLLCTPSNTLTTPGLRIDLMDSGYGLRSTLARLESPFSLVFTSGTTGASSTYAAVWEDTSGVEKTKGSGTSLGTFALGSSSAGARLVFTPHYTNYPNQALSLESGALLTIRHESEQAMASSPAFNITSAVDQFFLRFAIVGITGNGAVSGTGQATVSLEGGSRTDMLLTGTAVSLSITSPGSKAWCGFLRDEFLVEGATVTGGTAHCAATALTYTLPAATATLAWDDVAGTTTLSLAPRGTATTVTLHVLQVDVTATVR